MQNCRKSYVRVFELYSTCIFCKFAVRRDGVGEGGGGSSRTRNMINSACGNVLKLSRYIQYNVVYEMLPKIWDFYVRVYRELSNTRIYFIPGKW